MSARLFLLLLASLTQLVHVASLPTHIHDTHDHAHDVQLSLPGTWYHAPDHPAHLLFKRDPPTDGNTYPPVGSPAWTAAYPASTPNVSALPKPWVDSLNAAIASGKIPNIPQTTGPTGQNPVYPPGIDPTNPTICSGTYKCRNPDDTWIAPDGFFGTGFDDGPLPASLQLGQFLQQNNETATHFVIGVYVLQNPDTFKFLFDTLGHDIAVHTWTHPYMTKLSNLEVIAQLGWSMKIIHDSTGGRLPRFWRPPYGDSDNRVHAIAKEVFGLRTIFWNQDTLDWNITVGGTSLEGIANNFHTWATGPKSPGLIALEHELSNASVTAFMNAYPVLKSNGWQLRSVTQLIGNGTVYQNSQDAFSPVTAVSDVVSAPPSSSATPTTTSATAQAASISPSISMLPHKSVAQTRFGSPSLAAYLICVALALVAPVLLADHAYR